MNSILSALVAALQSLFHPRMLALMLWPMLLSLVLWVTVAMVFWVDWVAGLTALVQASPVEQWVATGLFAILSHYLITFLLVMLLLPLIYVTALAITALFVMPMMVNHVAARACPELQRKQGGSTAGSVWNTLLALFLYCAGWVLALPLWLFSPFAIVLPVILSAYLNQRLFRYDALAEHASREEYQQIVERSSGKLYLLGAATGLLQFVPVLNLFSPIYIGLAFIHFCLAELGQLRRERDRSGTQGGEGALYPANSLTQ
ncbi:MAG: EI24 domain-containing protein [Thiomonas sp.]|nr:EI24 domain-containing protein [Thiomonas sp.]